MTLESFLGQSSASSIIFRLNDEGHTFSHEDLTRNRGKSERRIFQRCLRFLWLTASDAEKFIGSDCTILFFFAHGWKEAEREERPLTSDAVGDSIIAL